MTLFCQNRNDVEPNLNVRKSAFVSVKLIFIGVACLLPLSQAFAQERERHRHFGDSRQEQRNKPREQFREPRMQNPERFKAQNFERPREQRQERLREHPEEMRMRSGERVREAESNRGDAISRRDADRSMPHLSRHFDEVDANRDGVVTPDERQAFRERRMRERVDRGRGDPRF